MFVHSSQYLQWPALQVWWPERVAAIEPLLTQTPVVMLWQCPEALVEEFQPWLFRRRGFQTPLVELGHSEEELWQNLEPKSCRYEVRKAQKWDCVITLNEETDVGRLLLNDSIRRLQYRTELSVTQWQELRADHDIFICRWQGTPVAVHVLLRDFPGRARLLLSGSEDRTQEQFRAAVGPANRLLHWHELQHYRKQGFRFYDFGGCSFADKSSPEYAISQFKMSFGGTVVTEPMLYLAGNPALRLALQGLAGTREALQEIPWPESWLQRLRQMPKLGRWFR